MPVWRASSAENLGEEVPPEAMLSALKTCSLSGGWVLDPSGVRVFDPPEDGASDSSEGGPSDRPSFSWG